METCQTCAIGFDSRETCAPRRYCSSECYNHGEKPYNKGPVVSRATKVERFSSKIVDKLHYLQHNNNDRLDCEWDICVEAKIFGL